MAQLDADLFNDTQGDIANITRGENRPSSYLGYDSPEIAKGLRLSLGLSKTSYLAQYLFRCSQGGSINGCFDHELIRTNHIASSLPSEDQSALTLQAYNLAIAGGVPLGVSSWGGALSPTSIVRQNYCDLPSFINTIITPGKVIVPGQVIGVQQPNNTNCKKSFGKNISFSLNYSADVIRFAIASQKNGKDGFDHNRLGMIILRTIYYWFYIH